MGKRISTQRVGRQRVSTKYQRWRKNERMFCGELFIKSERGEGGKEAFNQAVNGHDLQKTLRMPNVSRTRAAPVHEASGNNDNCT